MHLRLLLVVAALLMTSPSMAAPKPLLFGADYAPYALRVTLHFPAFAERAAEARCTPGQVELFRAFFARYLADAAPGLAAAYARDHGAAGAPGTRIGLDFTIGCAPDGGATITRYRPDQNWATMYYDPAIGKWQIVG